MRDFSLKTKKNNLISHFKAIHIISWAISCFHFNFATLPCIDLGFSRRVNVSLQVVFVIFLLLTGVYVLANKEDTTKFEFQDLIIIPDTIEGAGWSNISTLHIQDLGDDAVLQGFSSANSASLEIPDTPSTVTNDQSEVMPIDVGAGTIDGEQHPDTLSPDQRPEGEAPQAEGDTVSDVPQAESQEETNEEHVPDVPTESPVVDAPVSFNSFFNFSYDGFQKLFTEKSVGSFVSIAQATSSTAYDVDNTDTVDQENVQHIDETIDLESQPSEESITTTPDAPEQAVVTGENSTEQVIPQQNPVVGEVVRETVNPYIAKYHCALLEDCGVPVLEFSGFSVPSFDGATTIESAQIRLSFGAREAEDAENIGEVKLMYTFDEKTWVDAGSLYIEDEVTNAANGGHFLFALPDTIDDDALASLRVRVVYDGDYHDVDTLFIDSLWVELSAVSFYESEDGELLSEEIEYERELLLPTYNDLLVPQADFLADDLPVFYFKYRSQENFVERFFEFFSQKRQFSIVGSRLTHSVFGEVDVESQVTYTEDTTWEYRLLKHPQLMRPGKYTLEVVIEEDGKQYTEMVEFYWGVLAINTHKSMYHEGEEVVFNMAALTSDGDTICDAHLELIITDPSLSVHEVPVQQGGDCGPNNVTNIPDYRATFTDTAQIGEYQISLLHYNRDGQQVHHSKDTFEVREYIPYDIERTAPTRIYPLAPYEVTLKIKANRSFEGMITEAYPRGFVIQEVNEGGTIVSHHDTNYISWNASLAEGDEITLRYTFDAPDISPYLFLLGPLDMDGFKELRAWQIASDALGGVAWLSGTQTENGTNLNSLPAPARMLWSTSTVDTYYYVHSTSTQSERVTLRRSGDYYFAVTLPQQRADANATFTRIGIEVRINGVAVPQGLGRSGWIRGSNSHSESSSHASFMLTNIQPDDYVEVYMQDMTSVGADTVNVTGQASMYIEYMPTSNNIFAATATSTVASTSLNTASSSALTWTETRQDSGFVHSDTVNPENIIINNPGTYMVQVSIPLESDHALSVAMNVLGRVLLDGAQVTGGVFSQGLSYGNAVGGSNDYYSSIHWSGIVTATTSNQVLSITTEQEASAGSITVPTGFVGSIFVKEIPNDDVIVLSGKHLASTTNWSITPAQKILWDTRPIYDSVTFTHATTSSSTMGDITVNESGDYLLSYNDALTSANAYRNTRVAIEVDGVAVSGAQTKSQVIRNAGNHNNASGALVFLLKGLTPGQVVRVMVDEEATTGGTTNDVTDAVLMLWKKAELNLEPQAITFYDTPFDSIQYSSTTPKFEFSSVDPDGSSDMVYQISWSTSTLFIASTTKTTGVDTGFLNTASSSDLSPFVEGNRIQYTIQGGDALSLGTTYYWRVRATDITGSANYGDWSPIQSMTLTDGIETDEWFQTEDGQFDTDNLTIAQTNGNGSVEVAVADNNEVLFAYAESTNTTLQYRFWDGSAWGIEDDALDVGGIINWVVTESAPTRDEYIVGTLDASNDVNFQVYSASTTSWHHLNELTTSVSNASRRSLALAYETSSGDALAIACDGDADPTFQIWNGSAWAATGTVDFNSANNCEELVLASDPTSNEIILVGRDTGSQYEAQVWNGDTNTWSSSQILGSMQVGDEVKEGLSVVYEESGDQAIVVTTNGNANNFLWNSWNGSTWGSNATQALQNDFENGHLVADSGTDRIALCYINDSNYIGSVIWDGYGWGTNRNLIITGNDDRARAVDCEFETAAGRDGYIIAPYADTGVDGDYHGVYTSSWATSTGSDINDASWVQTVRAGDGLVLAMHFDDETDDIDFTYWNGSTWSTPHQTIEDTPSSIATPNFETGMMAAKRYVYETGYVLSNPIRHSAVPGQPTWGDIYFDTTESFGTDVRVQVYYSSTTACDTPVPDGVLSGNGAGFDVSQSPITIAGLATTTYSEICLRATLTQNGGTSPTLDAWRVTWVRQPIVSQNYFRWYANGSFLTPTDPWPAGILDLAELVPLSGAESINLGDTIRLRMSLLVENIALATSSEAFKLQYASGGTCALATDWMDVGDVASTTALWRGHENAIVGDDWYDGAWGRRIKIIVDNTLVDESLTDFPLYVNLDDLPAAFFDQVQSDGDDIRITEADGLTELPFELVSIDTASDIGELYVRADLASTTDTELYIYYANPSASGYAVTDTYGRNSVWDNSFEGVWHMNNSAATIIDSTGNGYTGTKGPAAAAPTQVSSPLGMAQSCDGNDYIEFGDVLDADTRNWSISTWYRQTATGSANSNILYNKENRYEAAAGGGYHTYAWQPNWNWFGGTSFTSAVNVWNYGVVTYNKTNQIMYKNGTNVFSRAQTGDIGNNAEQLQFCARGNAAHNAFFTGHLDEVRMSSVARTIGWIKAEYNNQSNATGFYDVSSEELISDGRTLSTTTLSVSDVVETYEEQNPTFANVSSINPDADGEWDFVLENNNASSSTQYCFRMVYADGGVLNEYRYYPQLITNAPPPSPVLTAPFDNEKVSSSTPFFEFAVDDAAGDDVRYQIQMSTDVNFSSMTFDQNSDTNADQFENIAATSDKDPFTSGQVIRYIPPSSIATSTYWWRVRASDPDGTNTYGEWSTPYSFTIDTTLTATTWFQTTYSQFDTNALEDASVHVAGDDVRITASFSYATVTSNTIDFEDGDASFGNAWGEFSFTDQTPGDVTYYLEYQLDDSSWARIPDADLPNNMTGHGSSPVSLITLDTETYRHIRVQAVLSDSGGSPQLKDWTVSWGYRIEAPILLSPFDNAKVATVTPAFRFTATDPDDDPIAYEFSFSTSSTFYASTTYLSNTSGFVDVAQPASSSPFASGDTISYTIQPGDALTSSSTYWWRVRANDGASFSPWSEPRSITVDESIVVSTWHQTTGEQFETDTLVDVEGDTTHERAQIDTTLKEAMIAYGEGSVQSPRYRLWDGEIWGEELTAESVGAQIEYTVLKSAPTRNEYALATLGTDGDMNVQIYNGDGESWGNATELAISNANTKLRGLDLAYESDSGDLMAVSCDGTGAVFKIWNGTSWSVSTTSITLANGNTCLWVKLASNPTSDEIIMVVRSSNAGATDYEALVWDGSDWDYGSSIQFGNMNENAHEGIALEYEESGNQAIAIVSNDISANFAYTIWNGGWSAVGTTTIGNDFEWGQLVRDKGTDKMSLCYIDEDADLGVVQWTGSSWSAFNEFETAGNAKQGRSITCQYETRTTRDGYLMVPYSDSGALGAGDGGKYLYYATSAPSAKFDLSTIEDSYNVISTRTADGMVLAVFLDDGSDDYVATAWDGTGWTTPEVLDTNPSVTGTPFNESVSLASRAYTAFTSGSILSTGIDYDDGLGPRWERVLFDDTLGLGSITYHVYYSTATGTALVPELYLPGNATGFTTSPIDLTLLDKNVHNELFLSADFECVSGSCPTIQDWTVEWAEGIDVSGYAYEYNATTTIAGGNVAVAVNGVLQAGKVGTILGDGSWVIENVTAFEGDSILVFIDGALDADEAVAVATYDGTGDMAGLELSKRHLTIGSSDVGTTTNAMLAGYDVLDDEDIFLSVTSNDLTLCADAGCGDARLRIKAGAVYQPGSGADGVVHDFINYGKFFPNGNTFRVSGSWYNYGSTTIATSTVLFTATSTSETLYTASSTYGFNNVTFGETSGTATWTINKPLDIEGTLAVDYGTLVRGTSTATIAQSLRIGGGGAVSGISTTTFDGGGNYSWIDTSPSTTNMGYVVLNGTAKTVTMSGNTQAQSISIESGNTLVESGSGHTLSVAYGWRNNGTFSPQSSTVRFTGSTTNTLIVGPSAFNNLTFSGGNGVWYFASSTLGVNGNLTIATGTVTLPSGTTTVGGSFLNTGGIFAHNNGEVRMTSNTGSRQITQSATPFYNAFYDLVFSGSGAWAYTEASATTTRNMNILAGTVTLASSTLTVGGDFSVSGAGAFNHNSGTLILITQSNNVVKTNGSPLNNLYIHGNGGTWYGSLWGSRLPLTINANRVATTTTNFPVYVNLDDLPDGFFEGLKADGSDIRITTSDGFTEVPYELVSINTTTKIGELYFKGAVSSTTNQVYYLYYNNPSASAYASTSAYGRNNVWTNGYVGVWHMDNVGSTVVDSTGNGYTGTKGAAGAAPTQVSSPRGNAQYCDGNDEITLGNVLNPGTSLWTITTWHKPRAVGTSQASIIYNKENIYETSAGGNNHQYAWNPSWAWYDGTGVAYSTVVDSWYYSAVVYDKVNQRMYKNGSQVYSRAQAGDIGTNTNPLRFCARGFGTPSSHLTGEIDEIRMSNVARSAGWVATEYNNQSSSTSFYSAGAVEQKRLRTFTDTNATILGNYFADNASEAVFPTGVLSVGGSFDNDATFNASSGTVRFNSTAGTETIAAGNSSFATVDFSSVTGNFTVTESATATVAVALTNASQFTASSGISIATLGTFSNNLASTSTTWTGSTIVFSGSDHTINAKAHGGDSYDRFILTGDTDIAMWNSSTTNVSTGSTSSLYSQDHALVDGALVIYGDYARTSGIEHWSYETDFDGASLIGMPRKAMVSFASSSVVTIAGATLSIVGSSSATTTMDAFTGTYALSVLRGTTTASHYSFAGLGASGLVLASSTKVIGLSDGAFTLGVASGTALTVSSSTINNATTSLQIYRVSFGTTTAITGRNVTQKDGNPSLFWWFKETTGNLDGEAFDNDTGDPGSIRWDDSSLAITISGTVYSDDGVTTMGAPTCNGSSPNVRVVTSSGIATSTHCSASNGSYSIYVSGIIGDVVLTTYLNTDGGARGAVVTKTPTGNITNHHIYANRIITKHQDVVPLSITDMAMFDSTDDDDVRFTVATGTVNSLTLFANTELHIASSTSFNANGDITVRGNASTTSFDGSLHIDDNATFIGYATSTYTLGGSFSMDSGATFTPASTSIVMNATTTGKTITTPAPQEITFNTLSFTGVGGAWNVNGAIRSAYGISLATGTVTGTGNITVTSGSFSGNGTLSLGSGTTTIEQTNTLGGTTPWTFGNLVLGNSLSVGTTTPGSVATTTVLGKLTISTAHFLKANNSLWDLAGTGNVFTENGTFIEDTSTVRYSGTGATNIVSTEYYNLDLKAQGGSPTYVATGLGIIVGNNFTIGGALTTTVTFDTSDPVLDVNGSLRIESTGTFIGSGNASTTIAGDWDNDGVFTHSGGTVTFDGSGTSNISAGTSWFANLTMNGSGTYTMMEHATATNVFRLANVGSFTLTPSQSLAVGGTFVHAVSGGLTTWASATLFLYGGGNYTMNASTTDDTYGTLSIGSGTQIRMWNSGASAYDVHSGGSLYSQDHANATGDLYIFGSYTKTTGTDYWNYETDFDGSILGSPRTADVYIAGGSSVLFTGGALAVIGTSTGSTTIQNQGSGSYAFRIGGTASTTWSYYRIRNTDISGLTFSGTPAITTLSYGDFEVSQNSGTAITVGGTALQVRNFTNNYFGTSGASPAYNVTATGTTVNAWKFTNHAGAIAGEAYDVDPGPASGDPGYLVWDNSSTSLSVSGHVYSGEGSGVSSACDGSDSIKLKVQGLTEYVTSCNGSGEFTFSNVSFNIGNSFIVYISGKAVKAATVSEDSVSTISNFDLYENRVIVRHEGIDPLSIDDMGVWDSSDDSDIPFLTTNSPDTLTLPSDRKLIVWNDKTFSPSGDVTVSGGGGGSSYDGTLQLFTNAVFDATGGETHTIGGSLMSDAGASIDAETSTFVFTTGGASRTIDTNENAFYNVTFNGGGSWNVSDSTMTTGNDFTITQGTVTLPTATTTVGGSFLNTGGTFNQNGGQMYFTASGAKSIRTGSSSFGTTTFNGSGSFTYLSTNSTSTGSFTILQGSVTASSGTLAVNGNFINNGTFTHGNGTLRLYSGNPSGVITLHGSDLGSTTIAGTGSYTMTDTNAALMGTLTISSGSLTLASGTVSIAGSFLNTGGSFNHSSGTVLFNSSDTGESINPGNSLFHHVSLASAGGGWTITNNATTTGNFSLVSATNFTQSSSTRLEVRGVFTNLVGGGATTWSGSTLVINSGTGYTINTRSAGGDTYHNVRIGSSTALRAWDSTGTITMVDTNSSFYSQDHAGVTGSLYIFGNYTRSTGTDYWSYATDFDSTSLGGSSRQVYVYFAQGASTTLTGGTLNIVGANGFDTTVSNQGSGTYGMNITGGTFNASYYSFSNMGVSGLAFSGASTTVDSLTEGNFTLAVNGGSLITVSSTTLNYNAGLQITGASFATTTAITGYNVKVTGTTTSAWTFVGHTGNFDGEAFDSDTGAACGSVRWDDSTCLLTQQSAYRWRHDDGGEGVPNSEWYDSSWTKRKRVTVTNADATSYTNAVVEIPVTWDGDMQIDFDDLRFTTGDGTTLINHFRETYTANTQAVVWVEVPTLATSTDTEIYMYYGNSGVGDGSSESTFNFIDTFEDGDLTDYQARTDFTISGSNAYERTNRLVAVDPDNGKTTSGGMYNNGVTVQRGETLRILKYIDMTTGSADEICTTFATQSQTQNYAVCLELTGIDRLSLAKNVLYRDTTGTVLSSTTVTYTTGWYEIEVDWHTSGYMDVTLSKNGTFVASTSATDVSSPWTTGGVGFAMWSYHGGIDVYSSRPLLTTEPSVRTGYEQVRNGASWMADRNVKASGITIGDTARLRLVIENTGLTVSDAYQLEFSPKGSAPSCESVSAGSFVPVPVQGSCGASSTICMADTTQVTSGDSTTDVVGGEGTFIQGKVVENSANTASSLSLAGGEYTEIEYAITLTPQVSDSSYCFRVSDNGTDIDSYAKVAELQLRFAPNVTALSINNGLDIFLTPGTTTTVYATGTATDHNGYTDLDLTSVVMTMYRSGVSDTCTVDNNNCYISTGPSKCNFNNCNAGTNSCDVTCSADFYYHADPTASSTIYEAETWRAMLSIADMEGTTASGTAPSIELNALRAFEVDSSIDYGALEVLSSTVSSPSTTIENTGNIALDLLVEGEDLTDGLGSTIPTSNQIFATSSFSYSTCGAGICTEASTTPKRIELDLEKPASTTPSIVDQLFWGITIPFGVSGRPHTGANILYATDD